MEGITCRTHQPLEAANVPSSRLSATFEWRRMILGQSLFAETRRLIFPGLPLCIEHELALSVRSLNFFAIDPSFHGSLLSDSQKRADS